MRLCYWKKSLFFFFFCTIARFHARYSYKYFSSRCCKNFVSLFKFFSFKNLYPLDRLNNPNFTMVYRQFRSSSTSGKGIRFKNFLKRNEDGKEKPIRNKVFPSSFHFDCISRINSIGNRDSYPYIYTRIALCQTKRSGRKENLHWRRMHPTIISSYFFIEIW